MYYSLRRVLINAGSAFSPDKLTGSRTRSGSRIAWIDWISNLILSTFARLEYGGDCTQPCGQRTERSREISRRRVGNSCWCSYLASGWPSSPTRAQVGSSVHSNYASCRTNRETVSGNACRRNSKEWCLRRNWEGWESWRSRWARTAASGSTPPGRPRRRRWRATRAPEVGRRRRLRRRRSAWPSCRSASARTSSARDRDGADRRTARTRNELRTKSEANGMPDTNTA